MESYKLSRMSIDIDSDTSSAYNLLRLRNKLIKKEINVSFSLKSGVIFKKVSLKLKFFKKKFDFDFVRVQLPTQHTVDCEF